MSLYINNYSKLVLHDDNYSSLFELYIYGVTLIYFNLYPG